MLTFSTNGTNRTIMYITIRGLNVTTPITEDILVEAIEKVGYPPISAIGGESKHMEWDRLAYARLLLRVMAGQIRDIRYTIDFLGTGKIEKVEGPPIEISF